MQLKLPVPHPVHDIDRNCAVSGLGSAHKGEGGAMLQVNTLDGGGSATRAAVELGKLPPFQPWLHVILL